MTSVDQLTSWPVDQFDCPIAAWHVAECSLSRIRVSLTLWLLRCCDGCCYRFPARMEVEEGVGLLLLHASMVAGTGSRCWLLVRWRWWRENGGAAREVWWSEARRRRWWLTMARGSYVVVVLADLWWLLWLVRRRHGGCRQWWVMVAARVWGKLGFMFWRWRWWRGSLPLDSLLVQGLLPRGLFWLANFKS